MEDEGLENYKLWSTWDRGGSGLGGRNGIGGIGGGGGKRGSIFHQGAAAEPPNGDGGGGESSPNILFWGDADDALGGSGLTHYGSGVGTSSSSSSGIRSRNIPVGRGNDGGNDMIGGSSNINNGDVIVDNSSSNHIQIYDPTADPRHEQRRPHPPTTPAQHHMDSNASQKNMIIVGVLIALIIVLCCILMFIVVPPVIKFFRKKIPVSKKRIERRYRTIDGWLITKAVQPCDGVCQCLQKHYGRNSNINRRTNPSATTVVATSSKKTEGEDVDAEVESTDAIEVSYECPDDDRNDNVVASDENVEVTVSGQPQKDDPFENGLLKSSEWLCKLGITQNGKILNGGDTNSNKDGGTIKCRDTTESKNQDMQKPCNCTKHISQTSKIIKHDGDVKNTNLDCCHAEDEDICDGNISVSSSSSSSSALSSLSKPCCSICLESFRIGDTLSWSTSSACPHVYHHACIREWLLRKVGCPYCRVVVFLPVDRPTDADNTSAGGGSEGGGSQPAFRRRPLTDEALGKLAAERAFRATTTYFCGDCGLVELDGFGEDHWERIRGFTNKDNNQKSKQDDNNPVKASLRRGRGVLSTFLPFFSSTDRHRRLPNVEDDRNNVDSRIQQDDSDHEIDGNLSVNDPSERDLLHDLEDPSSRGEENDDRDQEAASSHEHHLESLPICHVPLVQSPSASTTWSTTPMSVLRSTTTTTEISYSTSSSSSPSSFGVNTTTSTVASPVPYEQSSSFASSFSTDSSPPALVMGDSIEVVSSTNDNIPSRPAGGGGVGSSSGNDVPATTERETRNIEHDTDANTDLTLPNLDGSDENVPIIGLLQPRISPHQ